MMPDRERQKVSLQTGLYILHIDGGMKTKGFDGKGAGAIGALLKEPDLTPIPGREVSERLDPVPDPLTAEYRALMSGLDMAQEHGVEYLAVFSDSRTVVNQVNKLWDTSGDHTALCDDAKKKLKTFKGIQVSWVPRELNKEADELVKRAFKETKPDEIIHAKD